MDTRTARNIQLFSGDLRPNPGVPGEWSEQKQQVAREVHADVLAAFPQLMGEEDPMNDVEDHWEDACRISAAWRACSGELLLKEPGTSQDPWTDAELGRRIGPVSRGEEGGRHGADELAGHPLVRKHGGRAMFLGGLRTDDPSQDVAHWLAARHRDHGVQRGVVKVAAHKNGIWSIELDSDPEVINRRLVEVMDWTFIRLEGAPHALLVQDEIAMCWEYRLFVVDGRIESAAGCVEEFTPLDHDRSTGPMDHRVRRIRGHLAQGEPSAVEDRLDITGRLLAFGREVAAEHGGTVCIDVAINEATDQPIVIEMNRLSNSGLYASDPWVVTSAVVWAMDRGYARLTNAADRIVTLPALEGVPA